MSNATHNALLFLHALTPLHPGSGTALGVVDLPVQRERHTEWPTVPGSSLKGILRAACRNPEEKGKEDQELLAVYGPETADADAHAGALSVTDARILAFPVRSLRGVFAWVTCPAVLERLVRDAKLAGKEGPKNEDIPRPGSDQIACAEGGGLVVSDGKVVLEEFEFTRAGEAKALAEWVAAAAIVDKGTQDRIKTHLAVLHDDYFTHFVRHATEVMARIGLDHERKTVKSGALFYEEFLPAETLFYAVVLVEKSRRKGKEMSEAEVYGYVKKNMKKVLQVGAGETIGKGFCAARLWNGKEG
jgi:CRISPR-associated protein Cmr4